eukprot:1147680-Pelagomonas_calceolata.AAC.3
MQEHRKAVTYGWGKIRLNCRCRHGEQGKHLLGQGKTLSTPIKEEDTHRFKTAVSPLRHKWGPGGSLEAL